MIRRSRPLGELGVLTGTLAALLFVGAAVRPAVAQTVSEPRNFPGERFRLALDANGVIDVEAGVVPGHLSFDVGLWVGIADDPLVFDRVDGDDQTREAALIDTRVGAEVVLAVGLFDWVQLGLDIPVVLFQERPDEITGVGELPELRSTGFGSPRIVPKIRVLRQAEAGIDLAVMPTFVAPSLMPRGYFGQDAFTFEPELAVSRDFEVVVVAANFGYRVRPEETLVDLEVDDELFARVGAGLRLDALGGPPLGIDLSLAGATSAEKPLARGNRDYGEVLGSVRYALTDPLIAFAGGGVGVNRGFGTPDWRAFVGLRWTNQSSDRDDDGITDNSDDCPDQPEDFDGFLDADGCPELDNDRDGIPDQTDGAPLKPEDKDGFEDTDGVPDTDNDRDGVFDWDDDCINEPGVVENRGCPDIDTDGDRRVDRLDACPNVPEDPDGFQDEDGCPDPDDDLDGLDDERDACPRQPGPIENKGCPDTDLDNDSVVDRLDNCPTVAGEPRFEGCGERQLVRIDASLEVPRLEILEKVQFAVGKAIIRPRSYPILNDVAALLKAHPELKRIRIEGHTDSTGSIQLNTRLSAARARSVRTYLIGKGVEPGRLRAAGFGPSVPIASNETVSGRALNRRVEFRILPDDGDDAQR